MAPQPPPDVAAMRFRSPWRPYQARVLDALPDLLADGRLHVVAAPGSGKTVLGLEVFRRLAVPTVVLSPTRTIRDQWLERVQDFLPGRATPPSWLSRDLSELGFLTSLTYQALHTHARLAAADPAGSTAQPDADSEEAGPAPSKLEVAELVTALRTAGVRALILDEAHHLRAEWWSAIQEIVRELGDVTLVSLTATPPYDVVGPQWARYIELCGTIDEEISVPELVKAGTLCPHEDYVYLTEAAAGERAMLERHRQAVRDVRANLLAPGAFLDELAAHPWAVEPEAHVPAIMAAPDTAMALAEVLHAAGRPAQPLLSLLDVGTADLLAEPTNRQVEQVLKEYLFGAAWPGGPDSAARRALAQRLRGDDLLSRREFGLAEPLRSWPQLSLSSTKVEACVRITELERAARGDDLRQVILLDHIRDGEARGEQQRELPLGAWPVFHRLACTSPAADARRLVLHTGRLSIVHDELLAALRELTGARTLTTRPVPALPGYCEVSLSGGHRLTGALTQLLAQGTITVLVGTRSLLGEGWDAPSVNALVLASFVGSFMTTNQMRGRAIRTDPARPEKVASIWHLGAFARVGLDWDVRDLHEMARRFDTFVGVDEKKPVITAGLDRLHAGFYARGACRVPVRAAAVNTEMQARLAQRDERAARWRTALDGSDMGRVVPSVRVISPPRLNPLLFRGAIRALALQVLAIAMVVTGAALDVGARTESLGVMLGLGGLLLTLFVLPKTVRLAILFARHLPVDGAVRPIALAVRDALCETGLLPAELRQVRVFVQQDGAGEFHLALGGGTFAERSLFADCVHQVLAPIDRPRYLVTRRQVRWAAAAVDYHAVPGPLGVQSERAKAFLAAWRHRVAPGDLVYTRSDAGRLELLKARARSYSAAAETVAKRLERLF